VRKFPGNEFESFHDAFHSRVELVLTEGEQSGLVTSTKSVGSNFGQTPRQTRELIADKFVITDPTNRLTGNVDGCRSMDVSFAVANFLWSIDENASHGMIVQYNRHGEKFMGPDGKFQCAIPDRITTEEEGSLVKEVIRILKEDSASRRAVIPFIKASDIKNEPIDFPCPSYAHFMVRNDKLDLIVGMRSQSLLGVLPYDSFLFTMLQEAVAVELGVELGKYIHISDSLHIYDNELEKAEALLDCEHTPRSMGRMAVSPIGNPAIHEAEQAYRETGRMPEVGDVYWDGLLANLRIKA
jgi:thymidylate synthase